MGSLRMWTRTWQSSSNQHIANMCQHEPHDQFMHNRAYAYCWTLAFSMGFRSQSSFSPDCDCSSERYCRTLSRHGAYPVVFATSFLTYYERAVTPDLTCSDTPWLFGDCCEAEDQCFSIGQILILGERTNWSIGSHVT